MENVLLKYMERMGNKKEFKLFLDIITKIPKIKFAVVKISGATIDHNLDLIAQDIAFLNKLNIFPVVIHGAGAELDRRLPHSVKKDGIRVTSKEDMNIVSSIFYQISNDLCDKIVEYGGAAQRVESIFQCERRKEYGFVGEIKSLELNKIEDAVQQNKTPIISPIGICNEGMLNINADTASKEVIKHILPSKVIILTETGGILDENESIISVLNPYKIEQYASISGGMLLKVKEILDILKNHSECSIVITSALNLLKEIFTVKGSGTFIKSYNIYSMNKFDASSKAKTKKLLEDAFDKTVVDRYFEEEFQEIFYEENFDGIAVIKEINGVAYLDKLAVSKYRQETGLGSFLWYELTKKYNKLIWRVDPKNPLNSFYAKKSTGFLKEEEWNVYWINLDRENIFETVDQVMTLPKTVV
jgi:acetylglutamate kinase